MKTKFIIIAFTLIIQSLFSQEITGTWYGSLDVQGQKLPVIFHIEKEGNNLKSNFDSPLQGVKGIPIQKTIIENNELTFDASNLGITYKGKLNADKIEGNFMQNGMKLPLILTRNNETVELKRPQTPKLPFSYNTTDVSFKNENKGNLLAGTIAEPKNFDKTKPILVMITGSGTQNRDEELFGHTPFLVIADDLAKKGIATLRLDDRGIGGSEKGKEGATSADFAIDINSAVNYLIKNGYKNIGLIGHSEGGMIAPMVANMNKNVKFLVLLAAPGIPIEELLLKQNYDIGKTSGIDETILKTNEEINKKLYSFVINYKGKNLESDLKPLITSDLKKLPESQISKEKIEETAENQAKQISSPWFQYFLKFNPDINLSKIKIPVLAIDGRLDLQVSPKENLAGIKKSLTKAGNKHFETIEFDGLNHLMQTAKTGNPSEYAQIEETISPKVLDKISSWVLKLK
jgi:pimeloyl-ACP methyl ester carboxylesterase